MAKESLDAAEDLAEDGKPRSAASRFYYAAYQSATALLLYRGLIPPPGREAWSHEDTPDMVLDNLGGVLRKRGQRQDVANRLRQLYRVRVSADYISADDVEPKTERVAKDARFICRAAQFVLVGGRGGGNI